VSLQSGNPFNIVESSNAIMGLANTVRPNLVGTVATTGSIAQWFVNKAAFVNAGNNAFGNLGRNAVVGPGWQDIDVALIKNTKVTERVTAQFRADTFNLFNHPNWGQPGGTLGAASFGVISSTRFPTGDSGSSRQMQFALRLMF
jgi:hypothetical protein